MKPKQQKQLQLDMFDIFVFPQETSLETFWCYRYEVPTSTSPKYTYFMNDTNAVFKEEYKLIESGVLYKHISVPDID